MAAKHGTDSGPRRAVRFDTYEDLLAGTHQAESLDLAELVPTLFMRGRTLLQAPAGSGRTTFIRSLAAAPRLDYLVRSCLIPQLLAEGIPSAGDAIVDWIEQTISDLPGEQVLLCFDGLDEVDPVSAQDVLDAVERTTRSTPRLAVLLADRLVRRPTRDARWAFLGFETKDHQQSDSQPSDTSAAKYAAAAMDKLLTPVLRKSQDQIARGAFAWLQETMSTAAEPQRVERWFGESLTTELVGCGLLEPAGPALRFQHLLLHSYFAARAVATGQVPWSDSTWDALSINGGNYTPIGMLLDMLPADKADELIRSVDEWNYVASSSLLADRSVAEVRIGPALRMALLLLLGQRRLLPEPNTSVVASDLLLLQRSALATRIVQASSHDELVSIAQEQQLSDAWWERWVDVFTGRSNDVLIEALGGDDRLLGWTAANVLASQPPASLPVKRILPLTSAAVSAAVRWRAIHALGAATDAVSAEVAIELFTTDEDQWVQYGALRAFLRILSTLKDRGEQKDLAEQLADLAPTLTANPRWTREIDRATAAHSGREEWAAALRPVLEALWAAADSAAEEDRWRAADARLRRGWSGNRSVILRPVESRS